jgi:hypothetical protein
VVEAHLPGLITEVGQAIGIMLDALPHSAARPVGRVDRGAVSDGGEPARLKSSNGSVPADRFGDLSRSTTRAGIAALQG